MNKVAQKAAGKAVYTSPTSAMKVLRQYLREANNHVKVKGSQARFASPQSLSEWYQKTYGQVLEQRWFFRSLNAAKDNGAKIQRVTVEGTPLYRFTS